MVILAFAPPVAGVRVTLISAAQQAAQNGSHPERMLPPHGQEVDPQSNTITLFRHEVSVTVTEYAMPGGGPQITVIAP